MTAWSEHNSTLWEEPLWYLRRGDLRPHKPRQKHNVRKRQQGQQKQHKGMTDVVLMREGSDIGGAQPHPVTLEPHTERCV